MNRMKGETARRLRRVLYKFCAKIIVVECVQLIDCNICDTIDCLTGLMAQKEKSASDRETNRIIIGQTAEASVQSD